MKGLLKSGALGEDDQDFTHSAIVLMNHACDLRSPSSQTVKRPFSNVLAAASNQSVISFLRHWASWLYSKGSGSTRADRPRRSGILFLSSP